MIPCLDRSMESGALLNRFDVSYWSYIDFCGQSFRYSQFFFQILYFSLQKPYHVQYLFSKSYWIKCVGTCFCLICCLLAGFPFPPKILSYFQMALCRSPATSEILGFWKHTAKCNLFYHCIKNRYCITGRPCTSAWWQIVTLFPLWELQEITKKVPPQW